MYVKDLNFSTTEATLSSVFEAIGPVRSVKIARKKNLKDPSRPLSMGFGFVEFGSREDAVRAIGSLQGTTVDGHALTLKLAKGNKDRVVVSAADAAKKSKKNAEDPTCTKLLIKNIPFEADIKELKHLFK